MSPDRSPGRSIFSSQGAVMGDGREPLRIPPEVEKQSAKVSCAPGPTIFPDSPALRWPRLGPYKMTFR